MLRLCSPAVEKVSLAEVALASDRPHYDTGSAKPSDFEADRTKSVHGRVLVVEDDEPLARFLSRTLSSASHQIEIAHDGATALQMLRPAINLLILDLNLPGLDGFDVLRSLRPLYPKLPVLVLTARSKTEDMVKAFDSGADDCLIKPFSYVELLARVRALLRRNVGVLPSSVRVADLVIHREEHRVERAGLWTGLRTA